MQWGIQSPRLASKSTNVMPNRPDHLPTPARLDPRLKAEFLALSAALLDCAPRQAAAGQDAGALRFRPRHIEPPRDLDLPLLTPKNYPRPAPALIAAARAEVIPPPAPVIAGRRGTLSQATDALLGGQPVALSGERGAGKTALLRNLAHDPRIAARFGRVWWIEAPANAERLFITLGLALDAPHFLAADPADLPRVARELLSEPRTLVLIDDLDPAVIDVGALVAALPAVAFTCATPPDFDGVLSLSLNGLEAGAGAALIGANVPAAAENPALARLAAALITEDGLTPEQLTAALDALPPANRLTALYAESFAALPAEYQAVCRAFAASAVPVPIATATTHFENPLAAARALRFLERRRFIEREGEHYRVVTGWAEAVMAESVPGMERGESPPRAVDLYFAAPADDERIPQAAFLHAQGMSLVEEGRAEEAEEALTEALRIREALNMKYAAAETLAVLGRLAYLQGDEATAINRLEAAAERLHRLRDEASLEVIRLALCRAYRRAGRLDAALSVIDDNAPPEDLTALYRARGAWDNALAAYEGWIGAAGDSETRLIARIGYAETLILAGRTDDALAFVADDDQFLGRWVRAIIRHLAGDLDGALAGYTSLETVTPYDWRGTVARAHARALAASGDVATARMIIGAEGVWYEARLPQPVFARLRVSHALYAHFSLMLGDPDSARSAADSAREVKAERPDPEAEAIACRALGRAAWQQGDSAVAIQAFEAELAARTAERPPDPAEIARTLHNLGDIYRESGQWEAAIGAYRRALNERGNTPDSESDSAMLHMGLLMALRRAGKLTEAGEAARAAADALFAMQPPADLGLIGYVLANHAALLHDTGRPAQAEIALEKWIETLSLRLPQALNHPDWAVNALAHGLYFRTTPPITLATVDMAEKALQQADSHAPNTWTAWAARRDLAALYERAERWADVADVIAPLLAQTGAMSAPDGETGHLVLAANLSMGRAYAHMGDREGALQHIEAALPFAADKPERGALCVEAAELCRATGDDARAADYYARAIGLLPRERDPKAYAEVLASLGYARLRLGRHAEAVEAFQDALRVIERSPKPDPAQRAALLYEVGGAYRVLGQHKAAAGAYRAALTLQDSGRNPDRYIETLTALARAETAYDAYQGAVAAYHEALQFSSLSPALRQKLLSEQGAAYERLNQTRPAIKAYTAALALETGTPTERAALHRALAGLYMGIGEHAGAQANLEAAITAMGEMGDDADGPMLRSLGDTYRALERPADAIDAYRRARTHTDPAADPLGRAQIEAALGALLAESERYLEAIAHFEAALDLRRIHAPRETASIVDLLHQLAVAHEKRGELERAVTRLHESLVYLDERTAPEAVIDTLNRLGGLYMELRRPAEAAKAYEEGLRSEGRATNANPVRIDGMTFGLGRAKQALGQLEGAAELYRSVANSPRPTPAREGARLTLKAAEAEIARHMQTLDVAEQSWAVLSRSTKPDFKGLAFVMALQAQTLAALGRREAADHRIEQMLELLAARRRELPANGEEAAPLAILIRGWELECNGQKEAAAAEYRAALEAALRAPGANAAFLWALRQKATSTKA